MYLSLESFRNKIPGARIGLGRVVRFRDSSLPDRYKSQSTGRAKRGKDDNSCALWADPRAYGGFRVHSFRGRPYQELHREVCLQLGIAPWKPAPKKPREWKPSRGTFQLLSESKHICQHHGASDAFFDILVSDYRLAGHVDKDRVRELVAFLDKPDSDFERAWAKEPKTYTAQQRAAAHGLSHEQYCRLGLHMSGCAEKTPQERRRITRDKENAKRRAKRADARIERFKTKESVAKVATVKDSSLEAVVGSTVVRLDSGVNTWNKPRITESQYKESKIIKIDPKNQPKSDSESVPYAERVELMMKHCGLTRAEAEVESLKWEHAILEDQQSTADLLAEDERTPNYNPQYVNPALTHDIQPPVGKSEVNCRFTTGGGESDATANCIKSKPPDLNAALERLGKGVKQRSAA